MGIMVTAHGGICHLEISGALSGAALPDLARAIGALTDAFAETEIDLHAVDAADEAGVRMLLALKRGAGRRLRFINHSPVVMQAVETLPATAGGKHLTAEG